MKWLAISVGCSSPSEKKELSSHCSRGLQACGNEISVSGRGAIRAADAWRTQARFWSITENYFGRQHLLLVGRKLRRIRQHASVFGYREAVFLALLISHIAAAVSDFKWLHAETREVASCLSKRQECHLKHLPCGDKSLTVGSPGQFIHFLQVPISVLMLFVF